MSASVASGSSSAAQPHTARLFIDDITEPYRVKFLAEGAMGSAWLLDADISPVVFKVFPFSRELEAKLEAEHLDKAEKGGLERGGGSEAWTPFVRPFCDEALQGTLVRTGSSEQRVHIVIMEHLGTGWQSITTLLRTCNLRSLRTRLLQRSIQVGAVLTALRKLLAIHILSGRARKRAVKELRLLGTDHAVSDYYFLNSALLALTIPRLQKDKVTTSMLPSGAPPSAVYIDLVNVLLLKTPDDRTRPVAFMPFALATRRAIKQLPAGKAGEEAPETGVASLWQWKADNRGLGPDDTARRSMFEGLYAQLEGFLAACESAGRVVKEGERAVGIILDGEKVAVFHFGLEIQHGLLGMDLIQFMTSTRPEGDAFDDSELETAYWKRLMLDWPHTLQQMCTDHGIGRMEPRGDGLILHDTPAAQAFPILGNIVEYVQGVLGEVSLTALHLLPDSRCDLDNMLEPLMKALHVINSPQVDSLVLNPSPAESLQLPTGAKRLILTPKEKDDWNKMLKTRPAAPSGAATFQKIIKGRLSGVDGVPAAAAAAASPSSSEDSRSVKPPADEPPPAEAPSRMSDSRPDGAALPLAAAASSAVSVAAKAVEQTTPRLVEAGRLELQEQQPQPETEGGTATGDRQASDHPHLPPTLPPLSIAPPPSLHEGAPTLSSAAAATAAPAVVSPQAVAPEGAGGGNLRTTAVRIPSQQQQQQQEGGGTSETSTDEGLFLPLYQDFLQQLRNVSASDLSEESHQAQMAVLRDRLQHLTHQDNQQQAPVGSAAVSAPAAGGPSTSSSRVVNLPVSAATPGPAHDYLMPNIASHFYPQPPPILPPHPSLFAAQPSPPAAPPHLIALPHPGTGRFGSASPGPPLVLTSPHRPAPAPAHVNQQPPPVQQYHVHHGATANTAGRTDGVMWPWAAGGSRAAQGEGSRQRG
ncbi:unnamed protein product [Vitrella brassicaformis CCMP3155]|uniref:Uncharacterized protein n=2 Tax=Vitrella brassicaformis TaxID=1169539 RepID=A0A0G4FAL1_VITBC|nr:unnamed protein product [Vitrella brassicaformis CCMP3155]|eukprot:CEM09931.1 unnamed protein product [Vitrella brassicaformis CCMP3155]